MENSPSFASNIVAEAVDRGINYFDVAPTYGDAQERLGLALEPYRNKVDRQVRFQEAPVESYRQAASLFERVRGRFYDRVQAIRASIRGAVCPPNDGQGRNRIVFHHLSRVH